MICANHPQCRCDGATYTPSWKYTPVCFCSSSFLCYDTLKAHYLISFHMQKMQTKHHESHIPNFEASSNPRWEINAQSLLHRCAETHETLCNSLFRKQQVLKLVSFSTSCISLQPDSLLTVWMLLFYRAPINTQFPAIVPVVSSLMMITTISTVHKPCSMCVFLRYTGNDDGFATHESALLAF